jgi:CheB methylesterase
MNAGVVGIGASVGGLEALTELFGDLPAGIGLSYLVIQHVDCSDGVGRVWLNKPNRSLCNGIDESASGS